MTIVRPTEELPLRDDWALVNAASSGDSAAFGQLVRRHDDKMRGVVWRVVGSQSAMDDVLQDAYLKAWRAIGSYRGESAFTSWLYSIVYRTAIDWQRSQRRLSVVPNEELPTTAGVDHAIGIVESSALRDALASLPADQLAVVTLIDGEGRSYDEVAVMLDVSGGTVASRLHRARAALRDHLNTTAGVQR